MIPSVRPQKLQGRPGVLLKTPFDEFFLGQLKAMVPHNDRWFNQLARGWWIAEEHAEPMVHLTLETFGATIVVDEDGREITHERSGERLEQTRLF